METWRGDLASRTGKCPELDSPVLGSWPPVEMAEPLGTITLFLTRRLGQALGVSGTMAAQAESVLFGALAVAALWGWTRYFPHPSLAFCAMLSGGYVVLFTGYVEKGTIKSLALSACYLWMATDWLVAGSPTARVVSGVLLALAALMHGSALAWLPSHLWFVCLRPPGWRVRLLALAAVALPFALFALYLYVQRGPIIGGPLGNIPAFLSWTPYWFCRRYWNAGPCAAPFLDWANHFEPLWRTEFALAPLAACSVPVAALLGWREAWTRWLGLAAVAWIALAVVWFPVYGYFTDWDLFAATPFVVTAWALSVAAVRLSDGGFRVFAALWIAISAPYVLRWWGLFRLPAPS